MTLRAHWPALERCREAVNELLRETRKLKNGATALGRRRRGVGETARKRNSLAVWVGLQMIEAGYTLTAGAKGQFAQILKVVYTAACEETAPNDMFRDVHQAIMTLRERYPHLRHQLGFQSGSTSRRTESLHKKNGARRS
jgi:hypothetical protein